MTLWEELSWRGLLNQATHPELAGLVEKQPFTVYCGFDPTSDSLHVGSLVPLVTLARFQRYGHTPIALMGGATGMIGDPSGKTKERQLLDSETICSNLAHIEGQLRQFLNFSGQNAAIIVNNTDWLGQLRLVTFLRDVGKHLSVNVMMARESVKARLEDREHGISYTEFSYQALQAYDFMQLFDTYRCQIQIGGSDQWGNIVAGMDLTRRMREGAETYGLTVPLVTKADGGKFGKTEEGNVWLDAEKTSPYQFYQFWYNAADTDVVRYLNYFTFLSRDEIAALAEQTKSAPEARAAQKALAAEMTRAVHGETALADAVRASEALFGGDLKGLDDATLSEIFREAPATQLPKSTLAGNRALIDVLVDCDVFASKGEARRMIKSGGLYLNNQRVEAENTPLSGQALVSASIAVIRKGKKHYHLLRFE